MAGGISHTIGVLVRGHNALTSALVQAEGSLTSFRKTAEVTALKVNRAFTPPDIDMSAVEEAKGHLTSAGATALIAGGVIAGGLGIAVKSALSFKTSMAEVATLVDTSTVDMNALAGTVKSLSGEFGQMPVDTAKALYTTISAGFGDAADATTLLRGAMKLARGGLAGLGVSIDGLTSILNSYGLAANQVTRVSDLMFEAMKAGKTTIGELSSTMGRVTPLASAAGVSLDHLLAAASALTLGGLGTAEAVTSLRGILSSVIKPTSEAQKLAKSLGIQFDVTALKSMGFAGWLAHVAEKSGGSQSVLSQLFGQVEALSGALALTGSQAGSLAAILEQMSRSAGATDEAFRKVDATAEAAFGRVKANASILLSTLGEALLPALTGIANAIALVAGKFSAFAEAHPLLTKIGVTLAAVTAGVLLLGGAGLLVAGQIVMAMTLVNVSTGGILLAVGAVIVGVTALVTYFTSGADRMAKASEMLSTAWSYLKKGFYAVATPIAYGVGFLAGTFTSAWDAVAGYTAEVWPMVKQIVLDAWNVISTVLTPQIAVLTGLFTFSWEMIKVSTRAAWEVVKLTVTTAWNMTVNVIKLGWNLVSGLFKAGLQFLTGDWAGAWETIKATLGKAWENIKAIFETYVGWFMGLGKIFYDAGAGFVDALLAGVMASWERLKEGVTKVVEGIRALLPGSDAKEGPLADLTAAGKALMPTFAKGIQQTGDKPVIAVNASLEDMPLVARPEPVHLETPALPPLPPPTLPSVAGSPPAAAPRTEERTADQPRVVFERGAFVITVNGQTAFDDLEDRLTEIFSRAASRVGVSYA